MSRQSLATADESSPRQDVLLDAGWRTVAGETGSTPGLGFEQPGFNDHDWHVVAVPHDWDDYQVFLNGICEYKHLLGANFAFTAGQIRTRVRQVEAAGFNASRDAHHPHNLRYQDYWDRDGRQLARPQSFNHRDRQTGLTQIPGRIRPKFTPRSSCNTRSLRGRLRRFDDVLRAHCGEK